MIINCYQIAYEKQLSMYLVFLLNSIIVSVLYTLTRQGHLYDSKIYLSMAIKEV